MRKAQENIPCLDEIRVRQVLLEVVWIRGTRPVHQVQINIVHVQILERTVDALCDALVPWVVELGGDPDLLPRHT